VSASAGDSVLARGMFCTMPWIAITRPISENATAIAKVPTSRGDSSRARITKITKEKSWSEAMRTRVHTMDQRVFFLSS
jgi:hypothetical protein